MEVKRKGGRINKRPRSRASKRKQYREKAKAQEENTDPEDTVEMS